MRAGKQSVKKACMTCGQEFADAPDKCPFDGTLLSTIASELTPGTILSDRYEIIAAVAGGGMGQIYKAKHKLMNRTVAIKTIHLSLVSSGAALQRFQQEAQAISTLNHPNILTVFDFFISDDGQPYLVMDYLEGTNLQEVVASEQKLPLSRVLPIISAACAGFAHAHEHGIIHRDIKPANLMLVNFDKNPDFVKIVDFGIAKLVPQEGESRHLTATGDTFGSPEFMSPEQCRAKTPDVRSDIYSLGCVMYVAITGKSPFVSQDPMEIMYKQVHSVPPPPSEICPDAQLPKEIDEIVLKAIQKEPEQRFQSMDELRAAIETVIAGQGEALQSLSLTTSASPSIISTATANLTTAKPDRKLVIGIVGGALACAILIALSLVNQEAAPSRTAAVGPAAPAVNTPVQPASASGDSAQIQRLQQSESAYKSNFENGQTAFNSQEFSEARVYFVSAHSAAEAFGEEDPRYIDSLYWISKCDLKTGQYEQAEQGLQWVLYAQRSHYGSSSAQVRTTEHDLAEARNALKR